MRKKTHRKNWLKMKLLIFNGCKFQFSTVTHNFNGQRKEEREKKIFRWLLSLVRIVQLFYAFKMVFKKGALWVREKSSHRKEKWWKIRIFECFVYLGSFPRRIWFFFSLPLFFPLPWNGERKADCATSHTLLIHFYVRIFTVLILLLCWLTLISQFNVFNDV